MKTRVKTGPKTRVKDSAKKLSSAERIVAHLRVAPNASASELAVVANLTVKGVEWNLKALIQSGRVRHVGPARGGHWEVIPNEETEP